MASLLLSTNVSLRKSISSDRTYYIAAVEVDWDYAPNATNPFTGMKVEKDEQASTYTLSNNIDRIGSIYKKAVYREFTDATFTTLETRNSKWKHLGVMGPAIRGIVGERIKIIFLNNCSHYNYSMHPHGVSYNKQSEGALYSYSSSDWYKSVNNGGQMVLPKQEWVYIWDIRDTFTDSSFSSKFWFYHSHINEPRDSNAGLVGPIIITQKNQETSSSNLMPNDIDREFITLFTVFDENLSWYIEENVQLFVDNDELYANNNSLSDLLVDDDFMESNLMHSMNGYSWDVLGKFYSGIELGERVRWYIGAMGTEVDLHSAHWHGNVILQESDIYQDVIQLMPAYSTQIDMITDNAGTWFYHCHVNDHVEAGMIATYTVVNSTCKQCNGYKQMNNANNNGGNGNNNNGNGNANDNNQSFGDVMSDNETWITVGIVAIINLIIIAIIIGIMKWRKSRKERKYKQFGFGANEMTSKLTGDQYNANSADVIIFDRNSKNNV